MSKKNSKKVEVFDENGNPVVEPKVWNVFGLEIRKAEKKAKEKKPELTPEEKKARNKKILKKVGIGLGVAAVLGAGVAKTLAGDFDHPTDDEYEDDVPELESGDTEFEKVDPDEKTEAKEENPEESKE